ncbi:MAG: GlcG/HbpS family heme-binding protein, partial [Thermoanaerobaculia bacterium]
NQAPLSSRTVRFISGIHFPPGITNTPNAALYGIENTNRGCDFNVVYNDKKCFPRARGTNGNPCNSFDTSGCGRGIVTGKLQPDDHDSTAVLAGGIPLYRILDLSNVKQGRVALGKVVGGVGVVGSGGDPQRDEYAAVNGAFAPAVAALSGTAGVGAIVPVPIFPLPQPGNVFIDGLRLPFLGPDQKLKFNNDGLPIGLQPLDGTNPGQANGTFVIAASNGGCAPNQYLTGPKAGSALTQDEVDGLIKRSVAAAKRTRGVIRLPLNSYARMVISVADVDGNILAIYRMEDATIFSIDVAVAKARNVVYFSSTDPNVQRDLPGVPSGQAVTNRTIGFGAQPFFPPGINSRVFDPRTGPFFDLFQRDLSNFCSQGFQARNPNQNGIVFFPGATPLYKNGVMVGGLGVSGDGVEQDDYVTFLGADTFLPDPKKWADQIKIDRVRLPMFKFPRQPEGVQECGGKPCS